MKSMGLRVCVSAQFQTCNSSNLLLSKASSICYSSNLLHSNNSLISNVLQQQPSTFQHFVNTSSLWCCFGGEWEFG
eukprot:742344-Rhodomonas_salina.1